MTRYPSHRHTGATHLPCPPEFPGPAHPSQISAVRVHGRVSQSVTTPALTCSLPSSAFSHSCLVLPNVPLLYGGEAVSPNSVSSGFHPPTLHPSSSSRSPPRKPPCGSPHLRPCCWDTATPSIAAPLSVKVKLRHPSNPNTPSLSPIKRAYSPSAPTPS